MRSKFLIVSHEDYENKMNPHQNQLIILLFGTLLRLPRKIDKIFFIHMFIADLRSMLSYGISFRSLNKWYAKLLYHLSQARNISTPSQMIYVSKLWLSPKFVSVWLTNLLKYSPCRIQHSPKLHHPSDGKSIFKALKWNRKTKNGKSAQSPAAKVVAVL